MNDYKHAITDVQPTLIEVYAPWCPHCQREMPIMEELKEKFHGKAKIIQINGDADQKVLEDLKVRTYPTFILYKEGQEVWRDAGEKPLSELTDMINRFV